MGIEPKSFGTYRDADKYAGKNSGAGYGETVILSKKEMDALRAGLYLAIPGGEYGLVIGYEPQAQAE